MQAVKSKEGEEFDEKAFLQSGAKVGNITPKCSPFASPAKKHYLTPERENLEWVRDLKKVTRGRSAVQSSGKPGSGRRFINKEEFKRKSIECDLHPTELALRKGINPRDLSPIRPCSVINPYGGYFTKNTPSTGKKYDRRSLTTPSLDMGESDPIPRRRLSYDLNSPLVNPYKKLKAPSSDRPGSTPPTTDLMLSVKKTGATMEQISEHSWSDKPDTKFFLKKPDVSRSNDTFQFQGSINLATNSPTPSIKSAKSDKGLKHSIAKYKRRVKEVLWPPVSKLYAQNKQASRIEKEMCAGDRESKEHGRDKNRKDREKRRNERGSGDGTHIMKVTCLPSTYILSLHKLLLVLHAISAMFIDRTSFDVFNQFLHSELFFVSFFND